MPFRYDQNQIPYHYIVEVMNRFKGLDLVDTVLEELWRNVDNTVQEAVTKIIPKEKKNVRRKHDFMRRLYKFLREEEK